MEYTGNSTKAIHSGWRGDSATNSVAVPIYQTTSYEFNSAEHAANLFALKEFGNIYTRLMNPTTDVLEKRLAALEGGTGALVTSSGMSAIFLAITTICKAGDHVIVSSSLYGGTETLFRHTFPKFGIKVTFIDDIIATNIKRALRRNTKLIYFETIANPSGVVPNLEKITKLAHESQIPVMVDNTFAPLICPVFKYGVDIAVYSCTKWIGGHGTSIGGAIIDSGNFDWSQGRHPDFTTPDPAYHGLIYWDALGNVPGMGNIAFILKARVEGLRNIGMCPSPFNSFQLLQGIETLPLRMERHCKNALELAKWLQAQPEVTWTNYAGLPDHESYHLSKRYLKGGFGAVLGFGIKGGEKSAAKFIDNVKMAFHLANVGDARTAVIHPASTTHQQLSKEAQKVCGITQEFIRVSVGIEDIEDIKADFKQALIISQK